MGVPTSPKKNWQNKNFFDFFEEPQDSERRKTPGIYDSKIFGPEGQRVQIVLLDTRWWKSPFKPDTLNAQQRASKGKVGKYIGNTDSDATQLGDVQWKWFRRTTCSSRLKSVLSVQVLRLFPTKKEWTNGGVTPKTGRDY